MSDYDDYLKRLSVQSQNFETIQTNLVSVAENVRINVAHVFGAPDYSVRIEPAVTEYIDYVKTSSVSLSVNLKVAIVFEEHAPAFVAPFTLFANLQSVVIDVGGNTSSLAMPVHPANSAFDNAAKLLCIALRKKLEDILNS